MDNSLVRKLSSFGPLADDDRRLLLDLTSNPRSLRSHAHIRVEGEAPDTVRLISQGFACRYKYVETGERQIVGYLVAGDFCDLHVFVLKTMDHSIDTLSPSKVIDIPTKRVLEMIERPALARALWWSALVDEAILREWLVNVGQRNAAKRIAHLFCEIYMRLRRVGLADAPQFHLPLTQIELADSMGLSAVHVNRALQSLREDGLITFKSKRLEILDSERLREMSGFNPSYLHMQHGDQGAP